VREFALKKAAACLVGLVGILAGSATGASSRTCLSGAGWTLDGVDVCVPHTWNAADATDGRDVDAKKSGHDSASSDSYVRKVGVYSRRLPDPKPGMRYFVICDGVSSVAEVMVNDRTVGGHRGAFMSFGCEITSALKSSDNVLEIRADNTFNPDVPPISGDFNLYGGVYRDVWLVEAAAPCIDPLREVQIAADAKTGHVVATVPVLDGANVRQEFDFPNPTLWSPETPKLYDVTVKVGDDARTVSVGFRTVEFRDGKFLLNGVVRQIRGVCRHQDRLGKGWAVSAADEEEDVKWIKGMGADGVRTSHYPQSRRFYDLCDRFGLIVWTELPNVNGMTFSPAFKENLFATAREMVEQLGNHPSICMWGLFNELYNAFPMEEGKAEALIREVNDLFHAMDSSRPTVAASNDPRRTELNAIPDGLGLNLYPLWYDIKELYGGGMKATVARSVKMNGRQSIAVSEYGGSACVTQHADPLFRPAANSRFHPEEYQAYLHSELYRDLVGNRQVWGSFLWQMFDCGSDCRQEGDLPGINEKGLVSYGRETAKDAYYFYRANWNPDPMLHIVGLRRTETTNAVTTVLAFCNVGPVTLTVNGRKIGTQEPDSVKTVQWRDVQLESGCNQIGVSSQGLSVTAELIRRVTQRVSSCLRQGSVSWRAAPLTGKAPR